MRMIHEVVGQVHVFRRSGFEGRPEVRGLDFNLDTSKSSLLLLASLTLPTETLTNFILPRFISTSDFLTHKSWALFIKRVYT